jgi:Carboxypeptidase regulatory-like domain/TonB-dependent Receptor Plug Domain
VKDPNGAVIPNASLTITSVGSTGFKRTITTDDNGNQKLLQVPPGVYSITVAAISGFAEKKLQNVEVSLGRSTPIIIELGAQVGAVVDVTSEGISIDTTDSKIQTNITAKAAENLPKGTNFTSLLKLSPATRPEPLSGGFQVDGASGSENTFIIDGQEVTNSRTGVLNTNSNLPFELVQEVQIKSSGFEAEYGGATGGVINVVTKGGGNQIRGSAGLQFEPSGLQSRGRDILRRNAAGNAEYVRQGKDEFVNFFPSITLGGPIAKDKLWFFGSYAPQIFEVTRTINYFTDSVARPFRTSDTYTAKQKNEYAFGRIDAQPFSKLRLTGSFTHSPISVRGAIPSYATLYDNLPTGSGLVGSNFNNTLGGRQNATDFSFGGNFTITNKFIITSRYGSHFLNEKLGTYGVPNVANPRVLCSAAAGTTPPPAVAGCVLGQSNGVLVFDAKRFDASKRETFDVDGTISFNGGGSHEIKSGFQSNRISNDLSSVRTDQIVLRYGQSITAYAGRANLVVNPAAIGSGSVIRFAEQGKVNGRNLGLYVQDRWQPFRRLTLNLGVRIEDENVPSFVPGLQGLKFSWADKIAPRLGAAYDLTGDGKTKVSAFYGWFYDRFKYELPRGSFGGQYFHQFFFDILPTDGAAFANTPGGFLGNYAGTVGGSCPNTATLGSGRIRCDLDFRIPSNANLGLELGAIDPDLKPYRQSELTFTVERQLTRNFLISGRFTRKILQEAIEDIGVLTSTGSEAYIIGNPGKGLAKRVNDAGGTLAALPERNYNAFEVSLDRRLANSINFNVNYTYSRLRGNFSGLAQTDENGRTSPNVGRSFDLPHVGYTLAGGPDNGKLATDRPHVVKFYGSYDFNWNERLGFGTGNSTVFKLFTSASSGTPLTSTATILGIPIPIRSRGDLGRSSTLTSTDFGLSHRYKFGSDNRFELIGDIDVLNVFNENNVLGIDTQKGGFNFDLRDPAFGVITAAEALLPTAENLALARLQRNGAPVVLALFNNNDASILPNPLYQRANSFQAARTVRFGFRFRF